MLRSAPHEIAALGITNQRETTVVWNRYTGKPYANAIVWQDTRTAQLCDKLASQKGGQDRFRQKPDCRFRYISPASNCAGCLKNIPGLSEEGKQRQPVVWDD